MMINLETETYCDLSRRMNRNEDFKSVIISKTAFLKEDASNVCRLWHIKNKVAEVPLCLNCCATTCFSKIGGHGKGYTKYCSSSCRMSYINTHRTKQDASIRRAKIKQTCLLKYGADHYFSSDTVKAKKKRTYNSKYGVDNPSQLEWVKEKKKKTNMDKLGVENPSQSHEVQSKKSNKTKNKKFTTDCGKVFTLEGYEIIGLQQLLQCYTVTDVLHHVEIEKEIGRLLYVYNNKKSVYHPDFFIKSTNTVIEIKSEYWYNKDFARNIAKKAACREAGYGFEFWVYDNKSMTRTIL